MPDQPAPPPPPAPPAYQPAPVYATAPAQSSSSGLKLPAGMTLWDLIGLLIILIGAVLILVGFLFGDAAVSAEYGSGASQSTFQSDLEAFFVWAGVGIFLVILGWICRVMLFPMFVARKRAAPAAGAPSPAPTVAAAPAPMAPTPPPAAAPATPACANCGKPTTYIAQYGRYYCYACGRYV